MTRRHRRFFLSVAIAAVAGTSGPPGLVALSAQSDSLPGPGSRWSLAAVGDVIMTRRIAQFDNPSDPGFQEVASIIRGADAAFLNLELSLFRLHEFKGWPAAEDGGNWELGPPEVAIDLKDLGFDLFNRANNHTTDLGVEGMRLTNQLLDELELVHAGSGMNLGFASRPGYLDTPKGRIALIGFATTFQTMSRAGAPRDPYMGRPGLNALRVEYRYDVDPETFDLLRQAAPGLLGQELPGGDSLRVFGQVVRRGTEFRPIGILNPVDEDRILREIQNASDQADFVIVNGHSHEPSNDSTEPPAWMRSWAKRCLDAGAVTYIIHGPHQLRGIEIHDGKPIFYSLGNFVFQNETIDPMPQDNYERYGLGDKALARELYDTRFQMDEEGNPTRGFPTDPVWYESVIAVPVFEGNRLAELTLHPVELRYEGPRSQRGTPRIADSATGRKIIERIAEQSAAFGTRIVYRDGTGVWVR